MRKFNPFDVYTNAKDIRDPGVRDFFARQREGMYLSDARDEPTVKRMQFPRRLSLTFLTSFIIIGILITRIGYLQIARGAFYRESAEINRIRIQSIEAPRGIFTDRHGVILTKNIPNFVVSIIPGDLPSEDGERARILQHVSKRTGVAVAEIEDALPEKPKYSFQLISIADRIPYETALLLQTEEVDLPGVALTISSSREPLYGEAFSHIIGYTGKISEEEYTEKNSDGYLLTDHIGKIGAEYALEESIRGTYGKRQVEVDSRGKEKNIIAKTDAVPGNNIQLTIDAGLQKVLYDSLMEKIENGSGVGGAAVAINPRNGDVLALVSAPGYDLTPFEQGISQKEYQHLLDDELKPLFNRAIAGEYQSGSTIKPFIAAAALEEGVITPSTTVQSVGGFSIGEFNFPDWKAGGHGITDVRKAIAESVNTFFYYVGGGRDHISGLGVTRIVEYAEKFGFGAPTGISIPGEQSGLLPTKEWRENVRTSEWRLGDTYHLSIGQGDILVTPLQMATGLAAIINGGTRYEPEIVSAILSPDGKFIQEIHASVVEQQIVNSQHLRVVREGMRQAVISGSARPLQDLPVTSGGKTGTAQFGTEEKTHAWFTGFAPYENPEIVIAVLVEAGGGGYETALPVAKSGLQYYFNEEMNASKILTESPKTNP